MDLINGFLLHTPRWVWFLLAYLIWIGVKAREPGETGLLKLAIVPVLLTAWSLSELLRLFAPTPANLGLWFGGAAIGIAVGAALVRRMHVSADRSRGVVIRPGDRTLLPLVLATFLVKYAFGAIHATAPELAQAGWVHVADLGSSGLFTGIFLGKFALYALAYARAPEPAPAG